MGAKADLPRDKPPRMPEPSQVRAAIWTREEIDAFRDNIPVGKG